MMNVKVAKECSRCGKTEETEMSLEEAQQLHEKTNGEDSLFMETLTRHIEDNDEEGPEVIVLSRKPDDPTSYDIRSMHDLCHNPDAQKMKGCRTRVKNLVGELFMDAPTNGKAKDAPKKRSRKKKEVEEQQEAQA